MKLLTTNTKLLKSRGSKYRILGLALAPHSIGGTKVCPQSTAGCRSACNLWFAGRTVMEPVRDAMIRRKQWLAADSVAFHDQLHQELELHERYCRKRGLTPVVRLNVASDLDWAHVMRQHPGLQGYEYTKILPRAKGDWLDNYQFTYSRNERSSEEEMVGLLESGRNVAVVFDVAYLPQQGILGKLPKTWFGHKVVDGDKHDVRLREVDGRGVVVGLRLKGGTKARENARRSGFAVKP